MSNQMNEIFCFICGKKFDINEYYLHYIDCKDNFLNENNLNIIIFETPFFIDNLLNELNANDLDSEKIININKKFKNIYNNLHKETQSNFLTPQIKQENHLDVNLNNKKRKYTYDKKINVNLFQKQIIKKFNKIRKEDVEHLNTNLKIQNF